MTMREWAVDYCFQRGMFEDQAKAVVEALMADEVSKSMQGRWNDSIDAYPPALLTTVVLMLRRVAVAWIESNCPQAWFKPMFDGTAD